MFGQAGRKRARCSGLPGGSEGSGIQAGQDRLTDRKQGLPKFIRMMKNNELARKAITMTGFV
ncbi:hypothetical protein ABT56_04230 [Photobacterium aquae]|uniref:Uncharacterized protein n=1 Tax=Photobacterium aquae TaxID=1195763 RepID=A0A0J1JZZ9_9GAMM|nr:hypothetical protein ABT56_04230 [Photobacterium aquae]